MAIQNKRNAFAMDIEAAEKLAAENEKLSLLQLKIKNTAVLCSIHCIKKGRERAIQR